MTIVILCVILLGFFIIATESIHHINKAAVAMFTGVLCWLLYIGYGTDYVTNEHGLDFSMFLSENQDSDLHLAKSFIAQNVFVRYINEAAQVVFYLLSTMTIIEVLSNNGCFDFLKDWLRIRSAKKFFWLLCLATFLLSLILDNLTTVCLMLGIVRVLVKEERLRWMFGGAVVITANVAGAITVIGDSNTMLLWIKELVSPIMLTTKLLVPSIIGLAVVLLLISRKLPRTITFQSTTPIYRGDDSLLKRWQRTMMLVAGVGGLCFVPVFHYITLLPPFVGALCVLAFVWMVHELLNSSLLSAGQMSNMRKPLALQYDTLQNILYFLGIYMSLSAVVETGALKDLLVYLSNSVASTSCLNVTLGLLSAFFGNVCTLITSVSLFAQDSAALNPSFQSYFSVDGVFWPLLSYTTSFGGSLLTIGSVSGFSLMKMEGVTISWYFRHLTFKVLAGWITGLIVFEIIDTGFWLNI